MDKDKSLRCGAHETTLTVPPFSCVEQPRGDVQLSGLSNGLGTEDTVNVLGFDNYVNEAVRTQDVKRRAMANDDAEAGGTVRSDVGPGIPISDFEHRNYRHPQGLFEQGFPHWPNSSSIHHLAVGATDGGCDQMALRECQSDGLPHSSDFHGRQDSAPFGPVYVTDRTKQPPGFNAIGTPTQPFRLHLPSGCGSPLETTPTGAFRYQGVEEDRFDSSGIRWCDVDTTAGDVTPLILENVEPVPSEWPFQSANTHTPCHHYHPIGKAGYAEYRAAIIGHRAHGFFSQRGPIDLNLPLHVKKVGKISWSAADSIILPQFRKTWQTALDIIMVKSPHLQEAIDRMSHEIKFSHNVTDDDIRRLASDNLIVPVMMSAVKAWCNVFSVPELAKKRRRLICEPCWNCLSESYMPEGCEMPQLCDPLEISSITEQGAVLLDFPWFYGQFSLDTTAQQYYSFVHRFQDGSIQCFQLRSIPTGGRACPFIAQALSKSMAIRATESNQCRNDVYIDNIRFPGSHQATTEALQNFKDLCNTAGITLDPSEDTSFRTQYTFLGVECNHNATTVALAAKTREKLARAGQLLTEHAHSFTLRDTLALLGLMVWASRILGTIRASWYPFLKMIRRRIANSWHLDSAVVWWEAALTAAKEVIVSLIQHEPRFVGARHSALLSVFSDASLTGWGNVYLFSDRIMIRAGPFEVLEDIAILEARALSYAICGLPQSDKAEPCLLDVFVDNTTVISAVTHTCHRTFVLNRIVGTLLSIATAKGYVIAIHYIASLNNLADSPSRFFAL